MHTVTVADQRISTPAIVAGMPFRARRSGPELQLIEQFLASAHFSLPADCRVTIFREPRVEGSYPDLVLVTWKPSIAEMWNPARRRLNKDDLRVLQYLITVNPRSFRELRLTKTRKFIQHLEHLEEAGLLRRSSDVWRPLALSSIFATVSIIAIEAKVKQWRRAVEQALLNTWFASRSYVMLPDQQKNEEIIASSAALGIGVLSERSHLKLSGAMRKPISHASWQFNEWAWRANTVDWAYDGH
jgi:hypothetical protein